MRWCWWDGRQLSSEHEMTVKKMVMVGTIREEMRAAWRRGRGGSVSGSSKLLEEEKQPTDSITPCPPLWLARGMARVRMRKADVDKVSWLSEGELADNKLAKNNPLRLSAGDLIIATTVPPHSAAKASSQPATAVPEAPSLAAPVAPPLAPPLAPPAGGAAAVPPAADVTRPSLSALSSAKSRLRRAAGAKGGSEVTVKTGRVVPVREYGLFIDIEDEIAAIDRACAEAERLETEKAKQAGQTAAVSEDGQVAAAKPVEEHKE